MYNTEVRTGGLKLCTVPGAVYMRASSTGTVTWDLKLSAVLALVAKGAGHSTV